MQQHNQRRISLPASAATAWGRERARLRIWLGRLAVALGLLMLMVLATYNLEYNPHSWQDEGGTLSLARTLAEDGVYAIRSSEGYQTFGYVQSVGPTVVLPLALSFRLFGAGLLQGRLVMAGFLVLTLLLFYLAGRRLLGPGAAAVALALLVGVPAVRLLHYGRQALGEVPALGFFLAGWLVWARSLGQRAARWELLAGLLLGLAMVTKVLYAPIGFGTLVALAVLDRWYYRQAALRGLLLVGGVAAICLAAWWGWQAWYFGAAVFWENAAKMRALAASTSGLDLRQTLQALKFLTGYESGHFYYFWGFAALAYAAVRCLRRDRAGLRLAFVLLFTLLWLGYWMLWITPWAHYALPPLALTALFVAGLWRDMLRGVPWPALWGELRAGRPGPASAALALLLVAGVLVGYADQMTVRTDVLARDESSAQLAAYLNATVPRDAVVETWERELAILTDHRFHFPDQAMLIGFHAAARGKGSWNFGAGAGYFAASRPAYLVAGWYARESHIYDAFLADHGRLLATIGAGEARYEIYQLRAP